MCLTRVGKTVFIFFSLFAFRTRLEKQLQKTTPTIVTMETPGDDQSAARIAQLEVKLEEEEEKNRALERKVTARIASIVICG